MSKGLEALEKIDHTICLNEHNIKWDADKYDHCACIDIGEFVKCYDTIEKELKRLEELEKAFVVLSKDDEKAKKLLSKEIEKNRAFEIIKIRVIDMHDLLVYDAYSSFNQRRTLRGLTPIPKEEYDLLKEVLL